MPDGVGSSACLGDAINLSCWSILSPLPFLHANRTLGELDRSDKMAGASTAFVKKIYHHR